MSLGLAVIRARLAADVLVGNGEDAVQQELGAAAGFRIESERVCLKVMRQGEDAELLVV